MPLILKLAPIAVVWSPWLERIEYDRRFRRNLPAVQAMLDGSPEVALENMGGFRRIVIATTYHDREHKDCSKCRRSRPMDRFSLTLSTTEGGVGRLDSACLDCKAGRARELKRLHREAS